MNPRMVRILVLSYLVKTVLVGILWLAVPDLPNRVSARIRDLWTRATQSEAKGAD